MRQGTIAAALAACALPILVHALHPALCTLPSGLHWFLIFSRQTKSGEIKTCKLLYNIKYYVQHQHPLDALQGPQLSLVV